MSTTGSRGSARNAGIVDAFRTPIALWAVVVFMSLSFGAGLTLGVLARQDRSATVGVATTDQTAGGSSAGLIAPPLTQQQLQEGLPPGHPGIDGTTGASPGAGRSTGAGGGTGATGGSKAGARSP